MSCRGRVGSARSQLMPDQQQLHAMARAGRVALKARAHSPADQACSAAVACPNYHTASNWPGAAPGPCYRTTLHKAGPTCGVLPGNAPQPSFVVANEMSEVTAARAGEHDTVHHQALATGGGKQAAWQVKAGAAPRHLAAPPAALAARRKMMGAPLTAMAPYRSSSISRSKAARCCRCSSKVSGARRTWHNVSCRVGLCRARQAPDSCHHVPDPGQASREATVCSTPLGNLRPCSPHVAPAQRPAAAAAAAAHPLAALACVAGCTNTLQLSVPQQRSLAKAAASLMKRSGSPPQSRHTSCPGMGVGRG